MTKNLTWLQTSERVFHFDLFLNPERLIPDTEIRFALKIVLHVVILLNKSMLENVTTGLIIMNF